MAIRERWVIRNGTLVQVSADYVGPARGKSKGLQVIRDIEPYQSPVDDKYVSGRAARRDDLKRTGCREYEPTEKKYVAAEQQARDARFIDRMGEAMHRHYRD